MFGRWITGVGALALTSCQSPSQDVVAPISSAASSPDESHPTAVKVGYDLSEALCSGCHAIAPGQISPNPQSPSFMAIANTDGLTATTLEAWLRDSHNFPETMNFEVVDEDVSALSAYIITLRDSDYTPPNQ